MTESIRDNRVLRADAQDVQDATDIRRAAGLNPPDDTDDIDDQDGEVVVDGDDVSPHYGGRAQPGDVLGIETGGETTQIGDTDEDENKRRRDPEKDAGR